MEIKNKVIIVTGASEGIGLAAAKVLASKGATVILAARSEEKLTKIEQGIPNSLAIPTDMRDTEAIKNLIAQTVEKFGRIDILINNAGQGMYGPLENINIEQYKDMMELNVYGALRAMQAVIPIMRTQGGGQIINISSRVSKNYFPNLSAYASTKYALNALSMTARVELAKDNIVVSLMHPKLTATQFAENSFGGHPNPTNIASAQPGMEVDTPEQVAAKIADLITSEAPEAEM